MIDRDPRLRYGVATALVGVPLAVYGLSAGDTPRVDAQTVSSGTVIELCGPTLWRADSIRTGYPAPFGGMKQGDNYHLTEPLKRWDGFVIIGDRISAGNINEGFVSPQDLKITIIYTDDTDGTFTADFNAGNNIRYDFFDSNDRIRFDQVSLDRLAREGIERGRLSQGSVNFVISRYNASTQETAVMYRFNAAQADEFIKKQKEEEAKACATPTPTITATNTFTPTPTESPTNTPTETSTNTPTVTSTPRAILTATFTPTETPLSTVTSTATRTSTSTSTPTVTPPVIKSPTPDNLNCGFLESAKGWIPKFEGGGSYPIGEKDTFVPVTIRTEPFKTSALIASYLGYRLGGTGQFYEVPLNGQNEIVIALFPGGEFGTNWEVKLRALENMQLQTKDPSFGETQLALNVMRAHLIFRAAEIKQQERRFLDKVRVITFMPDGLVKFEDLNKEQIARAVRYENCVLAPVIPIGNVASGW